MYKRITRRVFAILVAVTLLLNGILPGFDFGGLTAYAATYDFGPFGAADGSGNTRAGSNISVLNGQFTGFSSVAGGGTAIYPSDPYASVNQINPSTGEYTYDNYTVTFKAEGGSNCKTFTFNDIGLSAYSPNYHLHFVTLKFYDANNNQVGTTENLGTSAAQIPTNSIKNLSTLYSRGAWSVNGVSKIEMTYSLHDDISAVGPANLQFENIAISDISNSLAPTVTGISPSSGPTAGGTSVTITGTNFTASSTVKVGTTDVSCTYISSTQLTASTPAHAAGTVDITVTTAVGTSATSSADQFTYVAAPTVSSVTPNSGPVGGGTSVTIMGTNFTGLSGASAVKFGVTNATSYIVNSSTQITAIAPAHGAGTVAVTVTTAYGSDGTASFTYMSVPTVGSISPITGPTAGGTSVVITGSNFLGATGASAVKFGTTNAASYTVDSDTQITAVTPVGTGINLGVTVTTAGGTSGESVFFTYAAPIVASISPNSGPAVGGTVVTILGNNFTAATAVKFGSTNASSYTVDSATQITATAPAGTGTVDIKVVTASGTDTRTAAFTYAPAPTVSSITATSGPVAGGTAVTIIGNNFTATSTVKFGTTSAACTVISATEITTTSPARAAGTVDVTVTTTEGGTSATSSVDWFTYMAVPTVGSISPITGPTAGGTSVVISGSNFNGASGASAVKFGTTNAASYTVNSDSQITAITPVGTGNVPVTITTAGGTSGASVSFAYALPTITGVSPTSGSDAGGTTVTITGNNFTAATAVKFGSTNALSFTENSATQITAIAPAGTGTVDITVVTAGGTHTRTSAFTYVTAPTITAVSPTAGPTGGGTTVTITGTGFTGTTAVMFGAFPATGFTVNSATQITSTAPSGTGMVDISVTTAGGTSATSSADWFTYVAAPTVTAISPNVGSTAGGTTVTITGANLSAATAVTFGAMPATDYTVDSASQITATAPAGTGTVDIRVTTAGGTSATSPTDQYTYVAAPTVTAVSPTSGPASGSMTVTITGTNFMATAAVTFGATPATSITVNSATQITATAPAGTGIVDIRVTTAGGTSATSAADQFTYIAAPTVTAISPSQGPTAGGTTVVITGTNFSTAVGASAVKFGAANATSYTVNSATQITAIAPAGTGIVDITVTTAGGTSATSAADRFTYMTPPAIGTQPENATVNEGNNTGFTVGATGTGITYQWQVNTGSGFANISNGGVYSGAHTATLSITGATAIMNGYSYRVIVNGTISPAATSDFATLTVHPNLTVSGNAGIGGATLSYADGTPKSATADGTGAYSFTVPYIWSGTVTPAKTGYTFAPLTKTYTSITANQIAQNYTATPNTYPLTYDYQGATGGNADLFKIVIFDESVGTLPTPTKSGFDFGGWYTAANGGGIKYTSETFYTVPAPLTLHAYWTAASSGSGGGSAPNPPVAEQPLTVLVTTTTDGETSSSASIAGSFNPATGTVSASVNSELAQDLIKEALEAKAAGEKAVAHVQFGTVAGATAANVELPRAELRQMAAAKTTLQLDCGIGTITLGAAELSAIARSAATGNTTLGIEKVDTEELSAKAQAKVKDSPIYRFEISAGDTPITRLSGSAKIAIPYTPAVGTNPKYVTTYFIDSKNVLRSVRGKYDSKSGTVSFSLPRL